MNYPQFLEVFKKVAHEFGVKDDIIRTKDGECPISRTATNEGNLYIFKCNAIMGGVALGFTSGGTGNVMLAADGHDICSIGGWPCASVIRADLIKLIKEAKEEFVAEKIGAVDEAFKEVMI